jgi:hypothetical protein
MRHWKDDDASRAEVVFAHIGWREHGVPVHPEGTNAPDRFADGQVKRGAGEADPTGGTHQGGCASRDRPPHAARVTPLGYAAVSCFVSPAALSI